MLLEEVMQLPASEINFWRAYYTIYPFPQERADARAAMIAQTISRMSGKMLKDGYEPKIKDYLPDYLGKPVEKSEEQKMAEEKAYVELAVAAGFAVMEKK
jgi:hypothetical protein